MGQEHSLSRREILNSIWVLGSGSLLLPLSVLQGEQRNAQSLAVIRGALRDGATGKPVAAKIRVTNTSSGETFMPASAIKTMPQRTQRSVKHYFYARGSYEVAVSPGAYRIEVVRGICHDVSVADKKM